MAIRVEWALVYNDTGESLVVDAIHVERGMTAVFKNGWFVGVFGPGHEIHGLNDNPELVKALIEDVTG